MAYVTKSRLPATIGRPESRLIGEYIATRFAGKRVALAQPLGPEVVILPQSLTQGQRLRVSRPWRPEVDALVWLDGVLLLIEAKVAEYVNGLAKLPLYRSLVPATPELEQWRDWEVRMRLVVPRARPWVNVMADAAGVEVDIFEPDWMRDYWEYRDQYWTGEYRARRQAILEARARAGLE
jgi:hypothetical protein